LSELVYGWVKFMDVFHDNISANIEAEMR